MKSIIEQLAESFKVNAGFVNAILSRKGVLDLATQAGDLDDFVARTGADYKYIAYALGTNTRGLGGLSKMLALAAPAKGGRALDVGCGYGGFMQAFATQGYSPSGVEIDAQLADLARINLTGSPYEFDIHVGDIFTGEVKIGSFDLITVNDVLEHLHDPIAAFNTLANMLNRGGVLAIYAPNGQSVFNATADPHNRVLGSSTMPGMLAKLYVQQTLNSTGYSLGEYLELSTIADLCLRNRLRFLYTPHDGGERPEQAIAHIKKLVDRFAESSFSTCSPILAKEVQTHIWKYIANYATSAAQATSGLGYVEFIDRYLARAWTICCIKD
jgi:2-polyprenyl-3-methyl-5-hydroxy-6-metoxy-1,4-benzoquinol methylase